MATTNVSLGASAPIHMRGGLDHVENASSFSADGDRPAPNLSEARRANRSASDSGQSVLRASRIQDYEFNKTASRRDPQAIDKKAKKARKPVPRWLREFVHNRATHLFCLNDEREISAVIREDLRNRGHKISEAEIDHILIGNALEHQRWRSNLSNGLKNITEMASEAAEGVWEAA